ncbi:MAG: glycoside hydrolase family 9 protein [Treponema sp.]|nr:glycoside hydrolase family 9 protein [Treponema sp.]
MVYVNQIGYEPDASKFVYVQCSDSQKKFTLEDKNGNVVFSGTLSAPKEDDANKIPVCCGDFSSYKTSGEYCVCVDNSKSAYFKIGSGIFNDFYHSILNYFYLSRCGEQIEGGDFSHPACHTTPAKIYGTELTKTVIGGWHDAGDYGRYVVAGSKTVMDLLLAYEANPSYKDFDILEEVRFELEWMLQMQREDGAVYHKISCWHFCAFINPQNETEEQVLAPVSTAATADFAGCLAYASEVYKKSDSKFAQTLLTAAKKAQNYLDSHEDELYTNPSEITTGGYGDWNVKDERYFALCALFNATSEKFYLEQALKIRAAQLAIEVNPAEPWKRPWGEMFGWGCVAGYGTEILLKNATIKEKKELFEDLKGGILARAEELKNASKNASFGSCLKKYFWGCNGHMADEGHLLLLAYDLTGRKEFYEAAKKQFDYILGCNQLDFCFVTGFGTNSPKNPHHRPSGAVGKPMPGMLAGGSCEGLYDHVAKEYLQGKPSACCYIDMEGSYSTNEVAIYWNSPLVYLTARVVELL